MEHKNTILPYRRLAAARGGGGGGRQAEVYFGITVERNALGYVVCMAYIYRYVTYTMR